MWSACVGVCQLLNWKMHGETVKFEVIKEPSKLLTYS